MKSIDSCWAHEMVTVILERLSFGRTTIMDFNQ